MKNTAVKKLTTRRSIKHLTDDSFGELLKGKETISIWCYSDHYFAKHQIPGFHTGMIISEVQEAEFMLGYSPLDEQELYQNMIRFSQVIRDCIDMEPNAMKTYILTHYIGEDEITKFNRKNILVLA